MPRLVRTVPAYQKHRASGQAVVSLNGHDYYLGPYGTKASKIEYDRLIGEWLQNGRQLRPTQIDGGLAIVELIAAYLRHVHEYYRKPDGTPTSEVADITLSLRPLKALYGRKPCDEFGPTALKVVRQKMITDGLSRKIINQRIGRVKRMFKWGAASELVPASIPQALSMVEGLKLGRSDARETAPILPVADSVVDATILHLPEVVADMVRLQRLTGCRPAEVCAVRPCDLDRTADVWTYQLASHKTQHHGKERTIYVGPQAQAVLLRYLARDAQAYCFRPCDSEEKRRAAAHAARKTPLSCGNRPGSNRVSRKRQRPPGESYNARSYHRAIRTACAKAFPIPNDIANDAQAAAKWRADHWWAPNQLRHAAATEIRRSFGLEAAQIVLGHSKADVTQVYAERDAAKGIEVARRIG